MSGRNEMPVKRSKPVKKKKVNIDLSNLNIKTIGIVIIAVIILFLIISGIRGCSVKQNTPQNVVKSMINFAYKGNAKKVKRCYDINDSDVDQLDRENEALIKYLQVHNSKGIEIVDTGVLYEGEQYSYVYITYNLLLDDEQKYPCIGTYIAANKDGKYYIVPTSNVTEEMSSTATEKYKDFTESRAYKMYLTTYDTFIKKNPGYEEKIADKLK
ncbi:MAG: hypothetical protein Q4B47_05665 [Eubacteriales bacterium]|nr:hypothetical protein [Eubacteriales bacterium]